MPGAFGPILTTGVALSAAVVVVANPVTAPHADVRITAADARISKAGGQAVDMLDEDFIKAVGPEPAGSINPLAILRDLVGEWVADAADLGKSAVMRAFIAGASVVSGSQVPELTAASYPYIVPPDPGVLPTPPVPARFGPVPQELRPVVEQALTAIIADTGDAADAGVVAAAFVAGAALASAEGPVMETLRGLVDSELQSARETVDSAVSSLSRPLLGGVVGDAVKQYLPDLPDLPVPSFTDLAVLPSRQVPRTPMIDPADAGPGPLAAAGPPAGEDAVVNRQDRPNRARALSSLPTVAGVDSVVPETIASDRPLPGPGGVGEAGVARSDRPTVSGIADAARATIGRATKAHAERTRE